MKNLNEIIEASGEIGSIERLKCIASLNLGERSEAAKRVIYKREQRKELMNKGFSFSDACLIVNNEQNNINQLK